MLSITIPKQELWDEETEEFIHIPETKLQLEHSLISLKKWESKWHKPFLEKKDKTEEELLDYIRCMTLTQNVNQEIYKYIPQSTFKEILDYIEDPMTATWFSKNENSSKGKKKETITAEVIYYWMITLQIPVQFEKWHLNQLMTLIRVVNAKNTQPKKMSAREQLARNARLNKERRAKYHSKG
jgi:hypothetical protein